MRSYVYIVFILCDEECEITPDDFQIYYWNTTYTFNKVNGKHNIFNNTAYSFFVEDVHREIEVIESTNKDVIDCVSAYTKELDFRNATEENFNDIKKDIDSGIEYISVEGAARSGKTIIAMRLLGEYADSVFLIMNYYFYLSLKDAFNISKIVFPENRIYHHGLKPFQRKNGGWISNTTTQSVIPSLSFLIVDEAQRLSNIEDRYNGYKFIKGIKEIDIIVNCKNHKHTIFFGDNLQRLNPRYDDGFKTIYDCIKNRSFREYSFKKAIGIPPEILNNVKYILDTNNDYHVLPSNKFEVISSKTIKDFISRYDSDESIKKHIVGVGLNELDGQSFEVNGKIYCSYPRDLRESDFPFLFNEEIKEKYILSTYQVISREIESVYLFLPKDIKYNEEKEYIQLQSSSEEKIEFLYYHLYSLMTRATLRLTIYCENPDLEKFIGNKIEQIAKINAEQSDLIDASIANEIIDEVIYKQESIVYDYDLFIAYHGTNDPKGTYQDAKKICDILRKKGLKVFLNNYSCNDDDEDLGFNETTHVIQRSNNFLLVFNDNVYRDKSGIIARKYSDGKPNQLYKEIKCFDSMVDSAQRTNKKHLRFFYSGGILSASNVYNFLNSFYREGTYGNSNCCLFSYDEIDYWLN